MFNLATHIITIVFSGAFKLDLNKVNGTLGTMLSHMPTMPKIDILGFDLTEHIRSGIIDKESAKEMQFLLKLAKGGNILIGFVKDKIMAGWNK